MSVAAPQKRPAKKATKEPQGDASQKTPEKNADLTRTPRYLSGPSASAPPAPDLPSLPQYLSPPIAQPDSPAEKRADAASSRVTGEAPRRGRAPSGTVTPRVAELLRSSDEGTPLSPGMRAKLGHAVRGDLSPIRLHQDFDSANAARDLSAQGFTFGSNIFLGAEASPTDAGLIAHEAQHAVEAASIIHRNPEDTEEAESPWETPIPMPVSVGYSIHGVRMKPRETHYRLRPGVLIEKQHLAMYLGHLLGNDYSEDVLDELLGELGTEGTTFTKVIDSEDPPTEPVDLNGVSLTFNKGAVIFIVAWLADRKEADAPLHRFPQLVNISVDQLKLLILGFAAEAAYPIVLEVAAAEQTPLPAWFSKSLFMAQVGTLGEDLRDFAQGWSTPDGTQNRDWMEVVASAMHAKLRPEVDVLEAMRTCTGLHRHPGFRAMWGLEKLPEHDPEKDGLIPPKADGPPESAKLDASRAEKFIAFGATQIALWEAILAGETSGDDGDPRVVIWERYMRSDVVVRSGDLGDQTLTDGRSDRNAPPLPSQVARIPAVLPPFYEASQDTTHDFEMNVAFSDVYEHLSNAFGGFRYTWELFKIPTPEAPEIDLEGNASRQLEEQVLATVEPISKAVEVGENAEAGTGYDPTGDLWEHRLRRMARDYDRDYQTMFEESAGGDVVSVLQQIEEITQAMGVPGLGAVTLEGMFNASQALSALGQLISSIAFDIAEPRNMKRMPVGKEGPGLYVVRAYCDPTLKDKSEYRRGTSVAWTPIWVRPPGMLAELTLGRDLLSEQVKTEELAGMTAQLASGPVDPDKRAAMEKTHAAMYALMHGNAGDVLDVQIAQLQELHDQPKADKKAKAAFAKQIKHLKELRDIRNRREKARAAENPNAGPAERLRARFVPDQGGEPVQPMIEVVENDPAPNAKYTAYDVGLGTGNHGVGEGSTRSAAIKDALEKLFEQYDSYGMGELAVFIPDAPGSARGKIEIISIWRDKIAITLTATENITTALSIAAMVAAPFTGGASLALMLPVGLVGAIPSAYRIADRWETGTLKMDMQTAMELVDIVGAFGGAAGEVISPLAKSGSATLRAVGYAGKGMMIVGVGADKLGILAIHVDLATQINKINEEAKAGKISEGERRARLLKAMGSAMQANGMALGGKLLEQAKSGLYDPVTDGPQVNPRADQDPTPRSDADPATRTDADGPTRTGDGEALATRADGSAPGDPGATGSMKRTLSRAVDLQTALPKDLQGDIRVEYASDLDPGTVQVEYIRGAFGLVSDIAIRVGGEAGTNTARLRTDIELHSATVRQIKKYMGVVGGVRLLMTKVLGYVQLHGEPPFGSLAYESMLEVKKLPGLIDSRLDDLKLAVAEGRSVDAEGIQADIDNLRAQLAKHQEIFDLRVTADGRGFVAGKAQTLEQRRSAWTLQKADEARGVWLRGNTGREVPSAYKKHFKNYWANIPGSRIAEDLGLPSLDGSNYEYHLQPTAERLVIRSKNTQIRVKNIENAFGFGVLDPPPAGYYYYNAGTNGSPRWLVSPFSGSGHTTVYRLAPRDGGLRLTNEYIVLGSKTRAFDPSAFSSDAVVKPSDPNSAKRALDAQAAYMTDTSKTPTGGGKSIAERINEAAAARAESRRKRDLYDAREKEIHQDAGGQAASTQTKEQIQQSNPDLEQSPSGITDPAVAKFIKDQHAGGVKNAGEEIGEASAEAYVRANFDNATMLWPRNESGSDADLTGFSAGKKNDQFDQVWLIGPKGNQKILFVEAKGPKGRPGEAGGVKVEDPARGDYAGDIKSQQGTPRYTEKMLDKMTEGARAKTSKLNDLETALINARDAFTTHMRDLRRGVEMGTPIDIEAPFSYLYVQANEIKKTVNGEDTYEIGPPTVKEFDLTKLIEVEAPVISDDSSQP